MCSRVAMPSTERRGRLLSAVDVLRAIGLFWGSLVLYSVDILQLAGAR